MSQNIKTEDILRNEVDHEPTGGYVLARLMRLERAVENASKQSIDEMLAPAPAAPAAPTAPAPAAPAPTNAA